MGSFITQVVYVNLMTSQIFEIVKGYRTNYACMNGNRFKIQQQMENSEERQQKHLQRTAESKKKGGNYDKINFSKGRQASSRKQSKSSKQESTQKVDTKNRSKKQQMKFSKNEKEVLAEKLTMATVLDVEDLQKKISVFAQCCKQQMCIPNVMFLLEKYQKLLNRAYPEQLSYYIIALLWDQGIVNVGKKQSWTRIIHQQLAQENSKASLIGKQADEIRQLYIKKVQNQLFGKKDILPVIKSETAWENRVEFIEMIEMIEQQYYRQLLTFKQLTKGNQQTYDRICHLFETLDQTKTGSLQFDQFVSKFRYSNIELSKQLRCFLLNRIVNNLHIHDEYSHTISNPENLANTQTICVNIEEIMQLANRVYQQGGELSFHPCQTYKSIHYIMSKYRHFEEQVRSTTIEEQVKALKKRNCSLLLAAQIQYIKQAATDIVHHSKINGFRLKSAVELDFVDSKECQTHRNKGEILIDDETTFRPLGSPKQAAERVSIYSKQTPQKTDTIKQQNTSEKNQAIGKEHISTVERVIIRKEVGRTTRDTNLRQDKGKEIDLMIETKTPLIKEFLASEESTEQQWKPTRKVQVQVQVENENMYDELLRKQIQSQLENVRMERIRNRTRYYGLAFQ